MNRFITVLFVFILAFTGVNVNQASAAQFSDVPASHGFYKDIQYLLSKGVISPAAKYGVDDKVTREEVAVMIAKAVGLSGAKTNTGFKDVSASRASSGYIKSAVDAGIIKGYTDGTFRPNGIVNRGEMAIFLARGFKLSTESPASFKDVTPSMASYSSVKKIVHAQITTGFSDKTFRPTQILTRGQISAFIARAMQPGKPSQPAPNPTPNPNPKPDFGTGLYVIPGAPTNFKNCTELRKYYPNGVKKGHPAFQSKMDRDNDGWACEA